MLHLLSHKESYMQSLVEFVPVYLEKWAEHACDWIFYRRTDRWADDKQQEIQNTLVYNFDGLKFRCESIEGNHLINLCFKMRKVMFNSKVQFFKNRSEDNRCNLIGKFFPREWNNENRPLHKKCDLPHVTIK